MKRLFNRMLFNIFTSFYKGGLFHIIFFPEQMACPEYVVLHYFLYKISNILLMIKKKSNQEHTD